MPQQLTSQLRSMVTVVGSRESRCISSTMSRPSVTGGTKKPRMGPPGSVFAHGTCGVATSVEKGMSWRAAGFASPRSEEPAAASGERSAAERRAARRAAAAPSSRASPRPRFRRAAESRSR